MKNDMKNGLSLISLIITIIVIIFLATIIIFSGMNTPDRAAFAKFTEEFSSYKMAITEDFMKKKSDYALKEITRSDEQIYYIIATGKEDAVDVNMSPTATGLINDSMIKIYPEMLSGTKYFEITSDTNINGVSKQNTFYEFTEKHYITDTGEVFILPGYLVEEDGNNKWYINENKYYIGNKNGSNSLTVMNEYSVGDYVDYIPKRGEYTPTEETTGITNQKLETDLSAKWRIVYTEGEKVYITPGIVNTDVKLMLYGNTGYFNGINVLNDICETLYSNADKGIMAHNLTISDMNKICGYEENCTTGYKYYSKSTEYGEDIQEILEGVTYTFSQATMKKRFYTGVGGTTKYIDDVPYQSPTSGNPVFVKNTSYSYNYPNETLKAIFNYHDVKGWIATTCVNTKDGYAEHDLFVLSNDGVSFDFLDRSSGLREQKERRNNTTYHS